MTDLVNQEVSRLRDALDFQTEAFTKSLVIVDRDVSRLRDALNFQTEALTKALEDVRVLNERRQVTERAVAKALWVVREGLSRGLFDGVTEEKARIAYAAMLGLCVVEV